MLSRELTETCHGLLRRELVPALGCTEPIAVALAAARAREELGRLPEGIRVRCSGNVIKNAKGVVVPGAGGRKGIDVSAVLGAVTGGSARGLEVLETVSQEELVRMEDLLDRNICTVDLLENVPGLDIVVEMWAGEDTVLVEIIDSHTEVTRVERNGQSMLEKKHASSKERGEEGKGLSLAAIYAYATQADLSPVEDVLRRQARYNQAISREGLRGNYGCGVGESLLRNRGNEVRVRAQAWAAAGSDARMDGCPLPVVINSGSGNQGMAASLPVLAYAQELCSEEKTVCRALAMSNLLAIYLKSGIGRLSAFCGAVGAACGAGAAITWLRGGDFPAVCRTVDNTLAMAAGIVCDGAKSSCAAKIATSVDAALLAADLALEGRSFQPGDGLVGSGADETARNIMRLGRDGMRETDLEILRIMTGQ